MIKPFHEAVVESIKSIDVERGLIVIAFGNLLKGVKLPKGHDEIVAAWMEKGHARMKYEHDNEIGGTDESIAWTFFEEVKASVLSQKPAKPTS